MVADTHPEQPALTPGSSKKTAQQPPPQAVMGLLNYITETSLDEDYAQVSEQRRRSGEVTPRRRPGTVGMAVLALFGVLVATAAVQTSRNADQSASSRASLVSQVNARADVLDRQRTTAQELQREITALGDAQLAATTEGRSLESRLNRPEALTGATAARGPGVRVVVDDAPGAKSPKFMVQAPDLQKLANRQWVAGADEYTVN